MGYRRICIVVLCAMLTCASAQVAKRRAVSKGPRALGLVEIDSQGRSHLVPICIMVDGKFYDASVYKADPVPMALEAGTVYEGVKTGISQGLFYVRSAIPAHGWLGLGSWKSNEQIEAEKQAAKARATKLAEKHEDDIKAGGPPRLSRTPEGAHPKSTASAPAKPADRASTKPDSDETDRPVLRKPTPSASSAVAASVDDSDRPVLRRQAPGEAEEQTKIEPDQTPLQGSLNVIPAISDADGPQLRPYTYQTKPEEDQDFMKKMSAMAADDIMHRAGMLASNAAKAKTTRATVVPEMRDQQLKVLDISGTNEAVLIYSANATVPGRADLQFSTVVVARQDIYADLHRLFAHTTDNNHLDMQPRYEFVDAVDVDGDGRGELLFKEVGDSGTGYAVYRVIGDRLWPLFESKPGA